MVGGSSGESAGEEVGYAAYRRLVVEHLTQLDDARVRRESPQRLDLAQVVDLRRRGSGPGQAWALLVTSAQRVALGRDSWGTGRRHLLKAVKVVLHALDGDVLAILDALRLQDL